MPFYQPNMQIIEQQAREAKERAAKGFKGDPKDSDFMESIPEGDTVFRFAPPWSDLGLDSLQVTKWFMSKDPFAPKKDPRNPKDTTKNPGYYSIVSPELTYPHAGIKDVVLSTYNSLLSSGCSKDVLDKLIRRQKGWYMNAWIRGADLKSITRDKPFIVKIPVGIYNWLAQAKADRRYGWILDPKEGWDVNINRVGMGFSDTKYTATLMPNAFTRGPGPIVQDEAHLEHLSTLIHNLHAKFPCYNPTPNSGDSKLDEYIKTKHNEMLECAEKLREFAIRVLSTTPKSSNIIPGYTPPGMNPAIPTSSPSSSLPNIPRLNVPPPLQPTFTPPSSTNLNSFLNQANIPPRTTLATPPTAQSDLVNKSPLKEDEHSSDPTLLISQKSTQTQDQALSKMMEKSPSEALDSTLIHFKLTKNDLLESTDYYLKVKFPPDENNPEGRIRYLSRLEVGARFKTLKGIEKHLSEKLHSTSHTTSSSNPTKSEPKISLPSPSSTQSNHNGSPSEPSLPGVTKPSSSPSRETSVPREIGKLPGAPDCYFDSSKPNDSGYLVISKLSDPAHPKNPPGTKCKICPFEIACKSAAETYQERLERSKIDTKVLT